MVPLSIGVMETPVQPFFGTVAMGAFGKGADLPSGDFLRPSQPNEKRAARKRAAPGRNFCVAYRME
jgi:hypothetical protein